MSTRATLLLAWLGCLALLGVNIALAQLELGALAPVPILALAAVQAWLLMWFFLHVRRVAPLVRLVAFAAFFWLIILFGMTLGDYLTRSPGGWPGEVSAGRLP